MFDDPKRELKRLEEELLAAEEEQWLDQELEDARRLLEDEEEDEEEAFYREFSGRSPVRNYANGYGAENTDHLDVDLDAYSDELLNEPAPKEKGIKGLLIVICLELLGIAAIAVYWLVQML